MGITLTEINKAEALRYMGYGRNKPDDITMRNIIECEKALLEAIKPEYVYRIFDIERTDSGIEILGTSLVLTGNDVAKHLDGCDKAALIAVTVSGGADRLIRSYSAYDMAKSVITDCLASAAVEQVCNEVDKIVREQSQQKYQTWRFSPGYGDFSLDHQGDFARVLEMQKTCGITLGSSLLMTPSKSVTAVIGLLRGGTAAGKDAPKGCAVCPKRDCPFRQV